MIRFTQFLSTILPPILSQKIRNYTYPIHLGVEHNLTEYIRSVTGSYLTINTMDYHGYRFFIHGFFEWRNVVIANAISKHKKGDIIEIGANVGTETVSFCDIVNSNGKVHAFEPLSTNIAVLNTLKSSQKNLIIYEIALSNKEDIVNFLIPPKALSGTGKIVKTVSSNQNFDNITAKPLDQFISKFNNVNFVSIDTEGHEPFVLEGGKKTLEKYKPTVVIEVSPKLLRKHSSSSSKDIYNFFKDLDYQIFKITRVSIVLIEEKDLLTKKSLNWLCIHKIESKIIEQVKKDLFLRAIFPWFILKKLPANSNNR